MSHAHAVELARERTPMHLIQRQLGHGNLGTTAGYLASIAPQEVIDVVSAREWPGQEKAAAAAFGIDEIAPGVQRAPVTHRETEATA